MGYNISPPRIAFLPRFRYNTFSVNFGRICLCFSGSVWAFCSSAASWLASKRGDEGEALKKVGIALIFIGTAILLFVLTINILVWTGRFGVAS